MRATGESKSWCDNHLAEPFLVISELRTGYFAQATDEGRRNGLCTGGRGGGIAGAA